MECPRLPLTTSLGYWLTNGQLCDSLDDHYDHARGGSQGGSLAARKSEGLDANASTCISCRSCWSNQLLGIDPFKDPSKPIFVEYGCCCMDELNKIDSPNYCIDGGVNSPSPAKARPTTGKSSKAPTTPTTGKSSKVLTTVDCWLSSEPSLLTKNLHRMLAVSLHSNIEKYLTMN
jgi:hypothetical protein